MFKYFKDFQYFLKYTILLVFLPSIFTGFYPGKITVMTTFCGWILFISYFNFKRKLFLNDFDGRNIILKSASHINGNLNGSIELEHYAS